MSEPCVFLSYAGADAFEADLLALALESSLSDLGVRVWNYRFDQPADQAGIARALRERVQASSAMVLLVSPSTLKEGAAQWIEFGNADAFEVPVFVLLHRLTFAQLRRRDKGVPPLLIEHQCTPASEWRRIVGELRIRCQPET